MLCAPGETRIRTLRLMASEDCRRAVADSLERVDWSLTRADEVLILRRMHLTGPLAGIGRLAGEQARKLAALAVHGWDAHADRADAVRFASRAELLACLLADLLGGRQRWFWRGWRELFDLPPGAAAARLMAAEPLHWPTLVHRLGAHAEQAALWHALHPADAQLMLAALERATGWSVARPAPPPRHARSYPQPLPRAEQPAWLGQARAVLATRVPQDEAVMRLAVVTWIWQLAPQRLAAGGAAGWITELARAWISDTLAEGAEAQGAPQGEGPQAVGGAGWKGRAGTRRLRRPEAAETDRPTRGLEPAPALEEDLRAANEAQARGTPRGEPAQGASEAEPRIYAVRRPAPETPGVQEASLEPADWTPRGPAVETRFVTRQGGWFLLLNALALPASQVRLQTEEEGRVPVPGWLWLYRLGRALGGLPDAPLAGFLARAAGLADAQALAACAPLSCEAELVRLAQAHYGEAVCNAGLLPVPALVEATSSHLDVYYRLSDVRLEVRRVALDVDPGWLAWLGRVVRFHYGHPAELAGLEAGGA